MDGRPLHPGPEPFEGVGSIGVLVASGIGDLVSAVPALRALRSTYPRATLTVLGDHWHEGFLQGRPGPWDGAEPVPRTDGVCRFDGEGGAALRTWAQDRRGSYDLVVQLHGGGAHSNEVVAALGPRFGVGSWTPGAVDLDRQVRYVPGRPEVLRCLAVAELAGARPGLVTADLEPRLDVQPADLDEALAATPQSDPYVVVHPGARDPRRCWPARRFAAVAAVLRDALDAHVLVVGGEDAADAARAVVGRLGCGATDLTGRLSLGGLLGIASRCAVFVGNDSGPRHLAAAVGAPTVGLFLAPNVMTFGPLLGDRHRAVVGSTMRCPTCGAVSEDACGHRVSWLADVAVEDVVRACADVVEAVGAVGVTPD
jgi:ADP-heptose:LPS heptosyltransferase